MNSMEPQCRYCSSSELYGKLISPCNCKGSVQFVHIKCLQNWLISSRRIMNSSLKYGRVYHLICELCHSNIYYKIHYQHYLIREIFEFIFKTMFNWPNVLKTGIYSFLCYLVIRKLKEMIKDLIEAINLKDKKSILKLLKCGFSLLSALSFFEQIGYDYFKNNHFMRHFTISFIDQREVNI